MMRIALLVERAVLSLMWLLIPFAPLAAAAIAGNTGYLRDYRGTMRRAVRHMHGMARARVISRNLGGDDTRLGTHEYRIEGSCVHCGRCCLYQSCMFLTYDEQGGSQCGIYGNWLFQRLTCGEYPISRHDIELYDCPSFVAMARIPRSQARLGATIIPIVVRAVDPAADRPREADLKF